jgi:hypothetical protein
VDRSQALLQRGGSARAGLGAGQLLGVPPRLDAQPSGVNEPSAVGVGRVAHRGGRHQRPSGAPAVSHQRDRHRAARRCRRRLAQGRFHLNQSARQLGPGTGRRAAPSGGLALRHARLDLEQPGLERRSGAGLGGPPSQ